MYFTDLTWEDLEFLQFNDSYVENAIYGLSPSATEYEIRAAAETVRFALEQDKDFIPMNAYYLKNRDYVLLNVLAEYIAKKIKDEI